VQMVIRQVSGLGNQLFQYAAGLYYAKRYGAQIHVAMEPSKNAMSHGHPRPFLLSKFAISSPSRELSAFDRLSLSESGKLKPGLDVFRRTFGVQVIRENFEERYSYAPDLPVIEQSKIVYLLGYWQNYRIAESISDNLRSEFRFREPAAGRNREVMDLILKSKTPVSLHIRRGDYTLAAEGQIALPIEYFIGCIQRILNRLSDPTFFVFSDDILFAKANLPQGLPIIFVDHNDSYHAHEDLRLMSSCHHHIIANSTFSWWGAWLNSRSDRTVFAPRDWLCKPGTFFPDLLPPEWIALSPNDYAGLNSSRSLL
jgi:hypothetical protein